MPTLMGRRYPPSVIYNPPQMSEEDYPIYKRWAVDGLKGALAQWFDVGLGEGAGLDRPTERPLQYMWLKVTQKRADVIVEYDDHIKILEMRHQASPNAIGRVLTYSMLWLDDPVIKKPAQIWIITNTWDPHVRRIAEQMGINYLVV